MWAKLVSEFTPPEARLSGEYLNQPSKAGDMWQLGVSLLCMMHGKHYVSECFPSEISRDSEAVQESKPSKTKTKTHSKNKSSMAKKQTN